MKNKSILSFFLALVMVFTPICFVYAEDDTTSLTQQNIIKIDSDAFDTLYHMGFLGDELLETGADSNITRAQFAGYLCKIAGYAVEKHEIEDIPFYDVTKITPYYNEICTLYKENIISGTEEGMFSPDNGVTYAQAAKMIIDVLKYKDFTQVKYGGFPQGYVSMAADLKLNKGIDAKYDGTLTADNAIKMLYNAGLATVMEPDGLDKFGNMTYKDNGVMLFTKAHNIYYGEGIIQCDGKTNLMSVDSSNNVVVNGYSYEASDADISHLLGMSVGYFYSDNKTSKKFIWAFEKANFNNTKEISAKDLIITDPEYSLTNIVYKDVNKKKENERISATAKYVYNNSLLPVPTPVNPLNPTDSEIGIVTGSIKMVDNNNDDIYDIVIIKEYFNVFVDNISDSTESIIDKYGRTIKLKDYDYIEIIKDGKKIELSDIKPYDVLSCYKNKNGDKIYCYLTRKSVNGRLLRKEKDNLYTFEQGSYRVSGDYLLPSEYRKIDLNIGGQYTVYLDIDGEIAAVLNPNTEMQYALITKAIAGTYEDVVYINLLLVDGTTYKGELRKKIILKTHAQNNSEARKVEPSEILNECTFKSGKLEAEVVKVSFDEEGNLNKIFFASDNTLRSENSKTGIDPDNFTLDLDKSVYVRNSDGFAIVNYLYSVDSSTKKFCRWHDLDGSYVYTVSSGSDPAEGTRAMKLYDINEDFTVNIIYNDDEWDSGQYITGWMIVDTIEEVYEDGQTVKKITGYSSGTYVTYTEFAPGAVPYDLKHGDIIQPAIYENKIHKVASDRIFRAETFEAKRDVGFTIEGTNVDAKTSVRYVPIYSTSTNGLTTLNPKDGTVDFEKYGWLNTSYFNKGATVTIYDRETGEMRLGDYMDLQQIYVPKADESESVESDRVMAIIRTRYAQLKDVILFVN